MYQRAKRPHPCRKTVFIKKFCRGSCFCLSHGFSMCFVRIWVCPWIIGTELSLHTCTARKAVGRERGPSVKIWHGVLEVIYLSRWPLFWGACLGGCSKDWVRMMCAHFRLQMGVGRSGKFTCRCPFSSDKVWGRTASPHLPRQAAHAGPPSH